MWEYMTTVVDLELLEDGSQTALRQLGNEGWEAYSSFPKFPHSAQIVIMLKRPKYV